MSRPREALRRSNPGCRAFSLIEVALALAVTSFALLSMVALIPLGLNSARQAVDVTTQSQIIQFSRNELELTSFTNLAVWNTATNYFDNQGLPTTLGAASQIYSVTYAVSNVADVYGGATNYPYATTNANNNNITNNALLVQVTIVNRTVAGAAATNLFPIVVPNAGF